MNMRTLNIIAACFNLCMMVVTLLPSAHAAEHRSYAAKAQFARLHPCPATHQPVPHCPGYVIDHIKPLACGGADAPKNMQWQTIAAGKAKDRWELKQCGK